jgi:hypothetical protein
MAYTAANKRRDTKKKWSRRMKDANSKAFEIQGMVDRYVLVARSDDEIMVNALQMLKKMRDAYIDLSNGYMWLVSNLSGG